MPKLRHFKEKIAFAHQNMYNIPGVAGSDYSLDALKTGIFYSGFNEVTMNVYISYCFFEDKIGSHFGRPQKRVLERKKQSFTLIWPGSAA